MRRTLWFGMCLVLLLPLPLAAKDLKDALRSAVDRERQKQRDKAPGAADAATNQPKAGSALTDEEEVALGRQIIGNLLGASSLVRDEGLQAYVNRVGRWVAAQSDRPDLPWRFGVIDSDDLNAFAAPGGWVLITRGLYRMLQSEAELAGVLGHEIAHVTRKHHLKLLQKSQAVDDVRGVRRDHRTRQRYRRLHGAQPRGHRSAAAVGGGRRMARAGQ